MGELHSREKSPHKGPEAEWELERGPQRMTGSILRPHHRLFFVLKLLRREMTLAYLHF